MKYIDADLLQKDIDELKKETADCVGKYADGFRFALEHFTFLIDHYNRQEQQEVNLEEEIEEYRMINEWSESIPLNLFKIVARYFYGLGQLNSK